MGEVRNHIRGGTERQPATVGDGVGTPRAVCRESESVADSPFVASYAA
jgi:hypothetical protein